MSQTKDAIIVGSGPAGYTAALYLARANMKPLVITGQAFGGLIATTDQIENFPSTIDAEGNVGIGGWELMEKMQQQAEHFGAETLWETVTELKLTNVPGGEHIVMVGDQEYRSKVVILSTGCSHRHIGIEAETRLNNKGVSYCATCDAALCRDKRVIVVGGGDSAITEALFLTKFASHVIIVHRRDQLRASKIMDARARANPKISFEWNAVVSDIKGDDHVVGVELTSTVDGSKKEVECDNIFVAIGHVPNVDLVKDQAALDAHGFVLVEGVTTKTSLPGVFAAGDVTDSQYRQAITAAGMGCKAALDAGAYLQEFE
ncbi:Thioredoxin reductase [Carpediemonas membranifera]|uniref:Thioredoxin reductase n=1 Tax=Carpediemonas membranifera TaxID=201153 RepID=A0A8J6B5K2_9EUKA|nr:Thioredoxin reductase [Carpediemonas membranifera]|eukprot:KAG9394744.1 Thioredoxin reductase [Carpediemonas membranifera]